MIEINTALIIFASLLFIIGIILHLKEIYGTNREHYYSLQSAPQDFTI